jgi:hypothetical protein
MGEVMVAAPRFTLHIGCRVRTVSGVGLASNGEKPECRVSNPYVGQPRDGAPTARPLGAATTINTTEAATTAGRRAVARRRSRKKNLTPGGAYTTGLPGARMENLGYAAFSSPAMP